MLPIYVTKQPWSLINKFNMSCISPDFKKTSACLLLSTKEYSYAQVYSSFKIEALLFLGKRNYLNKLIINRTSKILPCHSILVEFKVSFIKVYVTVVMEISINPGKLRAMSFDTLFSTSFQWPK